MEEEQEDGRADGVTVANQLRDVEANQDPDAAPHRDLVAQEVPKERGGPVSEDADTRYQLHTNTEITTVSALDK